MTTTYAPPHGNFGPGLPLHVSITPPVSGGAHLVVEAYDPAASSTPFYRETWTQTISSQATVTPMVGTGVIDTSTQARWLYSDDSASMFVYVTDSSNTLITSVTNTVTWENQQGVGRQIALKNVTGGLTAGQAAQLTTVENNTNAQQSQWNDYVTVTLPSLQDVINSIQSGIQTTIVNPVTGLAQTIGQLFSGKTLDTLTEGDLGSACWPDRLTSTAAMGGSAFGLQVQATTIPDYYAKTGPADDYYQESLFTLDIARGGNSVLRRGVHTATHLEYPMPGVPEFSIVLPVPVDPGDYTITITPNVGVCVSAQLLGFP